MKTKLLKLLSVIIACSILLTGCSQKTLWGTLNKYNKDKYTYLENGAKYIITESSKDKNTLVVLYHQDTTSILIGVNKNSDVITVIAKESTSLTTTTTTMTKTYIETQLNKGQKYTIYYDNVSTLSASERKVLDTYTRMVTNVFRDMGIDIIDYEYLEGVE